MSSLYIVLFCKFYVTIWCKDNKLIIYLSTKKTWSSNSRSMGALKSLKLLGVTRTASSNSKSMQKMLLLKPKECPLYPAERDLLRKVSPSLIPKILLDTKKGLGTVVKFFRFITATSLLVIRLIKQLVKVLLGVNLWYWAINGLKPWTSSA